MLILIWIFLVGSIVIMLADMMLEEWAGMDIFQAGMMGVGWVRQKWFSKGKGAAKSAVKSKVKPAAKKKKR